MSDVRKKIDLAFKSNVKDLITSIKDLQATIENVKKSITDLNAIQENNTKATNKRLDETNKNSFILSCRHRFTSFVFFTK